MSSLKIKTSKAKTENPCVPGSIPGGTTQESELKALETPLEQRGFSFLVKSVAL